jgi:predicted CoA-binding protein
MQLKEQIAQFLDGSPHAVVGASTRRDKYGNKVLRAYQQARLPVYPVNPTAAQVEGLAAYPELRALPAAVHGVSIVTPPGVTGEVLEQAAEMGIQHFWLQPGAESAPVLRRAAALGVNVIAGGPCLLVVLGYREEGI